MIDLFVKPGDEIIVNFTVALDEDGKIYADTNKEELEKMLKSFNCQSVKEYKAVFKRPNYKDTVELSKGLEAGVGGFKINLIEDKYRRMITLLKEWNLEDKEGNLVEPNEKNINNLNPVIANVMLDQLDLELGNNLV